MYEMRFTSTGQQVVREQPLRYNNITTCAVPSNGRARRRRRGSNPRSSRRSEPISHRTDRSLTLRNAVIIVVAADTDAFLGNDRRRDATMRRSHAMLSADTELNMAL